ncbi:hypothetical protein AAU61_21160 [Desulfocarbo indianensis]|nr:hypothetical protein AAU61_21160 [Desulfocarbo indianensis]
MLYAGMDVHLRTTYISVIDETGKQIAKKNLESNESAIMAFLNQLSSKPSVVMESTRAWYWLYDALVNAGYKVTMSNPLKTKAIASAKIKNDKLDAQMLAHLLRAGLVAEVYVSDLETRKLKELLRHRSKLVRDAARFKVRIRNLLAHHNVKLPASDLAKGKGRAALEKVRLPDYQQSQLETNLTLLDYLVFEVDTLNRTVQRRAKEDQQAQLLMSIPGVGPVVALTILAEVGDISRFSSHRKLASYAGLIPRLHASGGIERHGRITKQGSKWLRTALVEAAHCVARNRGSQLNIYFKKRIVRSGYRKAVVATAHRILQFAYYVLRDQTPYRAEQIKTA